MEILFFPTTFMHICAHHKFLTKYLFQIVENLNNFQKKVKMSKQKQIIKKTKRRIEKSKLKNVTSWNRPEWCAVIDKEVANDGNDDTVQKKEDKP